MPQTKRRNANAVVIDRETINPIQRDKILSKLMHEYSERRITLEQIKQRDPISSNKIKKIKILELLTKSSH